MSLISHYLHEYLPFYRVLSTSVYWTCLRKIIVFPFAIIDNAMIYTTEHAQKSVFEYFRTESIRVGKGVIQQTGGTLKFHLLIL
jgi:hypothetical protein